MNENLFNPAVDPEYSEPLHEDFGFAFDDSNFSDRVLLIEIMGNPSGDNQSESNDSGCSVFSDSGCHRKRRREDITKKENDQFLNLPPPDMEECGVCENKDDEANVTAEESHSGDDREPNWNMECSTVERVKTLHISSPILAAKSPFFYRIFSNGMKESEVLLRIYSSEEAALMELLKFMYSNTLSVTTAPALLDVLMAAVKFEVVSCMRYCSRLLRNVPMTREYALLYLELPSSVLMAEAVQPLTDAARHFLANHYKNITESLEEVIALPLSGIEAILSSDDLQVASEDAVYDFVVTWARAHYPNLEERREILGSRLGHLIRFPFMNAWKLKKFLTCSDFDRDAVTKLVIEALFYKAEPLHRQRAVAADEYAMVNPRFVERAYRFRPIKVVEFELPRPQCIVYLDLKREEVANLNPSGQVHSQPFRLGGQGFFLSAHCNMDQQILCFGLFLGMQENGLETVTVDYEFAGRSKPSEEYGSKCKGSYTFTGGRAVGFPNLFAVAWPAFISDDSPYFINDILHLRAKLTICSS